MYRNDTSFDACIADGYKMCLMIYRPTEALRNTNESEGADFWKNCGNVTALFSNTL